MCVLVYISFVYYMNADLVNTEPKLPGETRAGIL